MTAEQQQRELIQRVHELKTAEGVAYSSPSPPLLSSPAAVHLKRTAGAADLPTALPPFVKRIKRKDEECQTTLQRLEDKEMQTDEEGMVSKQEPRQSDGGAESGSTS